MSHRHKGFVMALIPNLFTVEALAVELGFDRRTVGRALRDVPADGTIKGRPGWRLKTAIRVLNRRDGRSGTGSEAAADEIEALTEKIDADFARAAEIADLEQRRVLLKKIGPSVGRLDRLMESLDDGDIVLELLHREALRDCVLQFNELWGPVQAPAA
jgi:DNA-binding transcriptional MocR family regulator